MYTGPWEAIIVTELVLQGMETPAAGAVAPVD
jgi:hypothetical protein